MSTEMSTTRTLDRGAMVLGTAMMIAWTLGIGIVGFVLLLAIAYAMVFQSHTVAVVLSFLLIAPLMLTIAWGIVWAAKEVSASEAVQHALSGPTWWEQRRGRALYEAYFI